MQILAAGLIGGGAILSGGIGGYFNKKAAEEQSKAALKAQREQLAFAREQMLAARQAGVDATGRIEGSSRGAQGALRDALGGARWDMARGYDQGRGDLQSGLAAAQGSMAPLLGMAGYAGQAAQGYNPYDLEGKFGSAMANWQADPGYQFRLQQGEQALGRSSAAKGGRFGAGALKELMNYGQGMASQEYGNVANRTLQTLMNQAGRSDQASAMANQNQLDLARMGLTGYGQLAGMQYGAGADLANQSVGRGSALGNLGWQGGQSLGNMMYSTGTDSANAVLQGAGMSSNIGAGAMPGFFAGVPYAGGGYAAMGNAATSTIGNLAGAAGLYAMNQPSAPPAEVYSL